MFTFSENMDAGKIFVFLLPLLFLSPLLMMELDWQIENILGIPHDHPFKPNFATAEEGKIITVEISDGISTNDSIP